MTGRKLAVKVEIVAHKLKEIFHVYGMLGTCEVKLPWIKFYL